MRVCLLAFIVFLAGCTQSSKMELEKQIALNNDAPEKFSVDQQEFEIIPFYRPYLDYVSEQHSIKGNSNEAFSSLVVQPLSKEIYGNIYSFQNDLFFTTPTKLDKLQEKIISLDEQHKEISAALKEGLEDAANLLPAEDFKIYLIPYELEYESVDMQGVLGFATDQGAMVLFIDPEQYTTESLKQTAVHEYHHLVFMGMSDSRNYDLLDKVMMEGKADAFAHALYLDYSVPWIEPLSPESTEIVWSFIEENQYSINRDDHYILQFGSSLEGIPQWSNYRIAFQIMTEFLKNHPQMTIEEWTMMPAVDIVEGSDRFKLD
ncbi:uncharacterized protein YjaZ [Cytobacillus horneckiae]|uniref:DUF2268 domain-containing protein n=1 Tax=Cytobacillus horneckiae TaxID=549687 RepID=UPI0019D06D80|nr:DUF2268 domain-containing putative Zn-dependent protease [Cytobacillus horneckiae]MBN6888710.1 hypothetical protein [Cytobacillus horneckiae]